MKPLLVYVAGPFSAPDRAGVEHNIRKAVDLGIEVAKLGAVPVIPHANTADPRFESLHDYRFWIAGTLALLERCDAIIMTPDWQLSRGAVGEFDRANALKMPTFFNVGELESYMKRRVT